MKTQAIVFAIVFIFLPHQKKKETNIYGTPKNEDWKKRDLLKSFFFDKESTQKILGYSDAHNSVPDGLLWTSILLK